MSTFAAYIGEPRCGKTTLLREHIYRSRQAVRAFLVMVRDRTTPWHGPTFWSVDELRRAETIPRFCLFPGGRVRSADVAQLAIDLGDAVYVDEEVQAALSEDRYGPARGDRPAHPLWRIAHEGAHLDNAAGETCEVAALLATHRPANLPADLLACTSDVYLGRTQLHLDVERCWREGWVKDATSPRDARRILGELRPGEFLHIKRR